MPQYTVTHSILQGLVEHVWIEQVSLGRSNSLGKVAEGIAKAVSTFDIKFPFNIRGVTVQLRQTPSAVTPASKQHGHSTRAAGLGGAEKQKGPARWKQVVRSKAFTNGAIRLVLGLLPVVPIRVKNITLKHKVGAFHVSNISQPSSGVSGHSVNRALQKQNTKDAARKLLHSHCSL